MGHFDAAIALPPYFCNDEGMPLDFDLPHCVRNIVLKKSEALLPLFEAVVNSIQAVRVRGEGERKIAIEVRRASPQELLPGQQNDIISGFSITDNGVGFTDLNLKSFKTYSSSLKAGIGGKGIGRFLWLKAFDRVLVESTFEENGAFLVRTFDFVADQEGVRNERLSPTEDKSPKTTIHLDGFKTDYALSARHSDTTIARRIIEHCMIEFMSAACPTIVLSGSDDPIILNDMFSDEVSRFLERAPLSVNGHEFDIVDLRKSVSVERRHSIHLCANGREVMSENLARVVPELSDQLTNQDGESYWIASYVSGSYLDDAANLNRTSIAFDSAESLFPGSLTENAFFQGVAGHIRGRFSSDLESAIRTKAEKVNDFIDRSAPEFRVVKTYLDDIARIPSAALQSPDKLRTELYRIKSKVRIDNKNMGMALLAAEDDSDADAYKQGMERFVEQWNQLGLSELAEYVIHRKLMLDLLARVLRRSSTGRYQTEDVIHGLIFPLKATSDDVDDERQNLWIVDERLAYHQYLASDRQIRTYREVGEFSSQERPDIAIFNSAFAFVEGDSRPYQSVVIVEFKRPMRDDYSDAENPIKQVYSYINRIREGRELDRSGRPIAILESTPFYVYIVCDLTAKLRQMAKDNQFEPTPDGMGFFNMHKQLGAYLELISFDKLLGDAQKRNRALFDKLNLPSGGTI